MLFLPNLVFTLWRGFVLVCACLILRLIFVCVYRLYFHPLAKYPGPWLAKITDLYGVYHTARGQYHIVRDNAHKQWGALIRLGPGKLVINRATALHDIYQSKDVQKSSGYKLLAPEKDGYSTLTVIDKSIHKHKRKILDYAFSQQSMRSFEPALLSLVDIFVACLTKSCTSHGGDNAWSSPINMTDATNYLAYDTMGKFGFGRSFEMQLEEHNRFLIDCVKAVTFRAGIYTIYPKLASLKLEKLLSKRVASMYKKYLELMSDLVRSRLTIGFKTDEHDLFSFLITAKDGETGQICTETELWRESRMLLVAGTETSSTALTALFFYLSRYPISYTKLATEIRQTFTHGSEIQSGPKLSSCRYLRACIDEALRMSPPLSLVPYREVSSESGTAGGGIHIEGEYIPPGIEFGVSIYSLHHNAEYFPAPHTFSPERWIESSSNPSAAIERARYAFSPFSIGSRACAGRNLAYMEIGLAIAKTMWYADFRPAAGPLGVVGEGDPDQPDGWNRVKEFQIREHLTSQHDGPWLEFRRREEVWGEDGGPSQKGSKDAVRSI